MESQAEVVVGDAFIWFRRRPELGDAPWVVFCSPPYDFYVERLDDMLELTCGLMRSAPVGSILVVESDARFDFQNLSDPAAWNVRAYPPAVVGIYTVRGLP